MHFHGPIIKPNQIVAMFLGFLTPVVYANEAPRYVLTPQIQSMPIIFSVLGLVVSIIVMGAIGFKRFRRMVIANSGR
ncbi:MAG: hypothetical protein ACI316_01685 [Lactimicrobium massiliense]